MLEACKATEAAGRAAPAGARQGSLSPTAGCKVACASVPISARVPAPGAGDSGQAEAAEPEGEAPQPAAPPGATLRASRNLGWADHFGSHRSSGRTIKLWPLRRRSIQAWRARRGAQGLQVVERSTATNYERKCEWWGHLQRHASHH